jgi:nucleoid DNA-binding protein
MKARNGVNPRTLGKMKIPAMKLPRFRAAKALNDAVKGVETKSGKKKK